MFDFNVFFFDVNGGRNHSIVNAKYANSAAEYIESTKGGRVYKVECSNVGELEMAFRKEVVQEEEVEYEEDIATDSAQVALTAGEQCTSIQDILDSGKTCVAVFNTHDADSTWVKRSGEEVVILRSLTKEEADLDDVGPMYLIRFADGVETSAFVDELSI